MEDLWTAMTSFGEPALRIVLAVLASGLIGWEREVGGHAAGLRTNMMVGLGDEGIQALVKALEALSHTEVRGE